MPTILAHALSPGLGDFYEGILHAIYYPQFLMGVIATSLLGVCPGRRLEDVLTLAVEKQRLTAKMNVLLLGLGLLAGIAVLGLEAPIIRAKISLIAPSGIAVISIIVGLGLALASRFPSVVRYPMSFLVGALAVGWQLSLDMEFKRPLVFSLGLVAALWFCALVPLAGIVGLSSRNADLAKISTQIFGSWCFAIGALSLAVL